MAQYSVLFFLQKTEKKEKINEKVYYTLKKCKIHGGT